jgi:GntR family transcriptional regulator
MIADTPDLLYHRVYLLLRGEIERGVLPRGARLPPERVICEQLSVSRATVRRAMRQLSEEGFVESWVGRGTFVTSGVLSDPPDTYRSFTELAAERGLVASARVLTREIRPAGLDEADALRIAPGTEVFDLERVRMLDEMPIALDHVRVPLAKAPSLANVDFSSASLYLTLAGAGVAPVRGDYAVTAVGADERQAAELETSVGAPLLLVTSAGYEAGGSVIELSETLYRADRFRFQATLHRS